MTPAQQAALAAEIEANPACADAVTAKDLDVIASIISAGRKTLQSRFVTARTILAECGANGPSILDALEAASAGNIAVKWALQFLGRDSGLDVGNPVTQAMIDQLVAGGALTGAQGDALKGLASLPAPVSRSDVELALFNPDGSAK
jgi:hypothetical protein